MQSKIVYYVKNLVTGKEREYGAFDKAYLRAKHLRSMGIDADVYMQVVRVYAEPEKVKVQV